MIFRITKEFISFQQLIKQSTFQIEEKNENQMDWKIGPYKEEAYNNFCYLLVPYFWNERTNTKVKIMCDEKIKSPQPYIAPRGTAQTGKLYKYEAVLIMEVMKH